MIMDEAITPLYGKAAETIAGHYAERRGKRYALKATDFAEKRCCDKGGVGVVAFAFPMLKQDKLAP